MNKKCSIYCFTNNINNKKYIGSTIMEPNKRFNQHIYNATHENSGRYNYPLYCAFRKYGIENFTFEILFQKKCTEKEIRKIEKKYIIKYNCIAPNGYNQTKNTIQPMSDKDIAKKVSETKRELAKSVAEVDSLNNILRIWRSIADCAEDIKINEKHIADVCRGERRTTEGRIFYWIDENNNLIIPNYVGQNQYKGAAGTTQIQSKSREVAKIDLETNNIIQIYPTIALAARENNCDASGISKVCRGVRKNCGGYFWQYIEK